MGNRDLAVGHPLGETTRRSNVLRRRDVKLSTEEERRKDCNEDPNQLSIPARSSSREELTVPLNRIVRDPTEHRELGVLVESKRLGHPREEVGQTKVPSSNSLGNPRRAARKRERSNRIRSKRDPHGGRSKLELRCEDVVGRGSLLGAEEESIGEELECGDFDADRELVGHVGSNGGEEGPGVGEDDEGAGLGDLEVDRLAGGRVGGICVV